MAFSDSDSSSSCSDPSDDWENDIVETSKPKSSSSSAKKDEAKGGIKLDIGTDKVCLLVFAQLRCARGAFYVFDHEYRICFYVMVF